MAITKDKFRNATDGYIGVVTLNSRGEEKGIAVGPGEEVWLNEDEQALTANAPRDPADNPLANGMLELIGEGAEAKNMRPLRKVDEPEDKDEPQAAEEPQETGAAEQPVGPPEEGSHAPGEEVGTPSAPRRARRSSGTKAAA